MISKFKISEKQGLLYSKKSGDKNQIHLDKITGYNSYIGNKICHGTLVILKYLKLTNYYKNLEKLNKYSLKVKFNKPFIYNENIYIVNKNPKIFQKNNGSAIIKFKKKFDTKYKKIIATPHSENFINKKNISHLYLIESILNSLTKYAGTIYPGNNCIISEININYNKNYNFNNKFKIYSKKISKRFPIIQNQIFFKNFYIEFTTLKPSKLSKKIILPSNLIKKKIKKILSPIIIIGASAGIGLETLKLLKLNKKIPIIATYHLNKINIKQKNIKIVKLDLNSNLKKLTNYFKNFKKLRIYYFATPKIFLSKNDINNIKLFKKFYIDIPIKILNLSKKNKLEFFYPSTININKSNKSDYSKIKQRGEKLISKYNKNANVNILRIDEINTKQNLALIEKNLPLFAELLNKSKQYRIKFFFE